MTTFSPAYRLTLYAPRSVDPAEATILTPPGGAVHADSFKVTTLNALAGWKPYLGFPRGRTGRVNALERTTDVGTMTFEITDAALVPGTNANRWVSAFLGNATGDPQLGGLKCFAEESTDGGTTWAAFWTGYVKALSLTDRRTYSLTVRDMTHELTTLPLFKQPPHSSITYAARPLLMPLGMTGASFGTLNAVPDLAGTIASPAVVGGSTMANVASVVIMQADIARKDNFCTRNLLSSVAPDTKKQVGFVQYTNVPNFTGTCRAHVTWNGGANQGDFRVGHLWLTNYGGMPGLVGRVNGGGKAACSGFMIQPLENVNDLNYSALPANGTAVTVRLFADHRMEDGAALLLESSNPLTILADILNGKFSQLYRWPELLVGAKVYGDVRRSFTHTISSANQPELPPIRLVIDKPVDNALEWLQTQLLKPNGLALVCNASGSFSVIDLRLPTSLAGVPTITDADVVPGDEPSWDFDRDAAIFRAEGILWEDFPLQYDMIKKMPDDFPEMTKLLLNSLDHPLYQLGIGSGDFGEKTWKMGGGGYRIMEGDALVGNKARVTYLQQKMLEQMNLMRRPYAHGATTTGLPCRRTATVVALIQGQVVQVNVSTLPNPATGKRGGIRICRVVEITRNRLKTDTKLLDLGIATVSTAPTLGAPALGSDPRHTATVLVTLNGTVPAEIRYALTVGGAVPADNDPAWHFWEQSPVTATATITLTGLTPGMRLWVQARTMPNDRASLLMPSLWTTSASLDLTAYAVPSVVSVTSITARSALVAWTNGTTDLFVELWLRSPSGAGAYTRIASLLPGSVSYPLWGLAASTSYDVLVQYRSQAGLISGTATQTFSTTGSDTVTARPPILKRILI